MHLKRIAFKIFYLFAPAAVVLAGVTVPGLAETKHVSIPYVREAPAVEARADDPAWRDIDWHSGFVLLGSPETPAEQETRFKLCHDNQRVYVLVEAFEPDTSQLALFSDSTRDAALIWQDDSVEFFLNPYGGINGYYQGYYQFIVNWQGAVWDARAEDDNMGGYTAVTEWDADVISAARVEKDRWRVEFAIPFADMELADPDLPEAWGINVGRNRGGVHMSWSPLPGRSFGQPQYFTQAVMKGLDLARFRWDLKHPEVEVTKEGEELVCDITSTIANYTDEFRIVLLKAELRHKDSDLRITEEKKVALIDREERDIRWRLPLEVQGEYDLRMRVALYAYPEHALRALSLPVNLEFQPVRAGWIVPAYRDNIYASQNLAEAVCEISVDPAYTGKPLVVQLHGRDGLAGERLISESEIKQEVSFPVKKLPEGDYILRVSLSDLSPVEVPLRKLPYREGEVWLDGNGAVYVDGEPFVPFGWFSGPLSPMPFVNSVQTYNPVLMTTPSKGRDFLDRAHEAGLKVLVIPFQMREEYRSDWRDPLFRGNTARRGPFTEEQAERVRAFIEAVGDHPAILGWYMADEPEARAESPQWYRDAYRLIRELDPYHPCIMLNYGRRGMETYYESCDILMPDCYPVFRTDGPPRKPLRAITEWMRTAVPLRPSWLVPQAFSWSPYGLSGRAPTLDELRNQIWQTFIAGGKGILLYTWGYHNLQGSRSSSVLRYGPNYLGAEIEAMKPGIIAPDMPGRLKVITEPEDENFVASLRREGDTYFLMAANTSYEERTVHFQLNVPDRLDRMYVVGENREVELSGGRFTDTFGPAETHLYSTDIRAAQAVDLQAKRGVIERKRTERRKPGNLVGIGELEAPEMKKIWDSKPGIIRVSSSRLYYGGAEWHLLCLLDGLTDEPLGPQWQPGRDDETPWVEVLLPEPGEVGRVRFYTLTGISGYEIMLRTPDGELLKVAEGKDNVDKAVNVVFPAVEASAVRIVLTEFIDGRSTITEIEVYEE